MIQIILIGIMILVIPAITTATFLQTGEVNLSTWKMNVSTDWQGKEKNDWAIMIKGKECWQYGNNLSGKIIIDYGENKEGVVLDNFDGHIKYKRKITEWLEKEDVSKITSYLYQSFKWDSIISDSDDNYITFTKVGLGLERTGKIIQWNGIQSISYKKSNIDDDVGFLSEFTYNINLLKYIQNIKLLKGIKECNVIEIQGDNWLFWNLDTDPNYRLSHYFEIVKNPFYFRITNEVRDNKQRKSQSEIGLTIKW